MDKRLGKMLMIYTSQGFTWSATLTFWKLNHQNSLIQEIVCEKNSKY